MSETQTETKASWVTAKPEEIKEKIVSLAKQGMTAERIGLVLRDQHGMPKARLLGLRIKHVLHQAGLWNDHEQIYSEKRIDVLKKHAAKNKHDHTAQRSLVKRTANFNLLRKKR